MLQAVSDSWSDWVPLIIPYEKADNLRWLEGNTVMLENGQIIIASPGSESMACSKGKLVNVGDPADPSWKKNYRVAHQITIILWTKLFIIWSLHNHTVLPNYHRTQKSVSRIVIVRSTELPSNDLWISFLVGLDVKKELSPFYVFCFNARVASIKKEWFRRLFQSKCRFRLLYLVFAHAACIR